MHLNVGLFQDAIMLAQQEEAVMWCAGVGL